MKKILPFVVGLLITQFAFAWGQTGHRVVGEIAWHHLSKKAKKNIERVLQDESLAMCANYMDFIKSEPKYDSLSPWHYCTIPDGETYAGAPEEGDVIMAIEHYKNELKTGNYSVDEAFALKCLVHLIGDIHQPLHVGNGEDRGGNSVKIEYMWKKTNLHRVWDSEMIDGQQLSYTEYAAWVEDWITPERKEIVASWHELTPIDWAKESMAVRDQVYTYPENGKLSYGYTHDNIALLNQRLLQAGLRLAEVLNNIYG
jgi:hypothetical protein